MRDESSIDPSITNINGQMQVAYGQMILRVTTSLCFRAFVLITTVSILFPGTLPKSEAGDLTDVLIQGSSFSVTGFLDSTAAARATAPAFSDGVAQAVTQEFPLASIPPAFTYYYDPTVAAYRRESGVPGPLFSERASTLAKGKFNFNIGYAYIDFNNLNGTSLDNIRSPGLLNEVFVDEGVLIRQLSTGEGLFFAPASLSQLRTRISLHAHIIVPTIRYGITNRWEMSLSIPIVNTSLRIRNEAVRIADVESSSAGFVFAKDGRDNVTQIFGFVDSNGNLINFSQVPFVQSQRSSRTLSRAGGSATGVGDITLRSKYHLWKNNFGRTAFGLNLQLPTGEARDFHGTDETHLSTFLYFSRIIKDRFEPHFNIGVDFNVNDIDRSSFLYAVGGTLLIGKDLGVMVDFIGRSEFGRLPVDIPPEGIVSGGAILDRAADTCTAEQPCFAAESINFPFFPEKIKRNDIVDFSFGFRYTLKKYGSIFFGVIVPLNDDGFRPDFIPSGGIEYTF